MLFHRIRTTSAVYHFRLPLSTSGSAHVHVSKRLWVLVPQVELNFLLSFLSTCYLSSTSFYLYSTPFCVPVFIQLCLAWNRERVALQLRDNQRLSTSTLLAVLFHRIRTTSEVYHFRLPLSTSGSAHVHVSKRLWVRVSQELNFLLSTCYLSSTSFYLSSTPFYLFLSFLYPFLSSTPFYLSSFLYPFLPLSIFHLPLSFLYPFLPLSIYLFLSFLYPFLSSTPFYLFLSTSFYLSSTPFFPLPLSTSFYLSSTPFCVPVFIQLCLAWNRERVALQLRAPPIDE